MSARRHLPAAAARIVCAAALALAVGGCTGEDVEPSADPSAPPTPLSDYDTTTVAVQRAPYCDALTAATVEDALGAPPSRSTAYDNGDRTRVASGPPDVAHEYGCRWSAGEVRVATWVFAPPVTGERAADLLREARTVEGCEADDQAPAFGAPFVALVCTDERGVTASYRGLFGDAWLVCELTGDGDRTALMDRAGRWCVQVVEAARPDAD